MGHEMGYIVPTIKLRKGGDKNLNALFKQRMSDSLEKRISALAKERGMNRTAFINMILANYVDSIDEKVMLTELVKRVESIEKEIFKK
jgi:predicted DNA-binding protein